MTVSEYYDDFMQRLLSLFQRVNQADSVEKKVWEIPAGTWEVCAVRGPVLEKATASRIQIRVRNPLDGIDTRFNILQINIFPRSPAAPAGLCNIEHRAGAGERFAGYAETASATPAEESLKRLRAALRRAMELHGCDYERLRQRVENMIVADGGEKPLNDGAGIRLEFSGDRFDALRDAVETWADNYFKIVDQTAGMAWGAGGAAQQDLLRARLVQYYILKDISFKTALQLGLPFEALSLMAFPPVVRF